MTDNVDLIHEYRDPAYGALVRVYRDTEYDAHDELDDILNEGYTAREREQLIKGAEWENRQIEQGKQHAVYFVTECLDGRHRNRADGVIVDSLDLDAIIRTVREWCHLGDVPILWSEWVGVGNTPERAYDNFVPIDAL